MKKGKFIAIEGADGAGKTVQFGLLKEYLKKKKTGFVEIDFPRYYDSPFGELAGEYLKGEHGPFSEISGYMGVLPYMLDEYTWSRDTGKAVLEEGKWVVSNRYFTSNFGHQVAKQKGRGKEKLREWLWKVGFEELGILKPNLVILLSVGPVFCQELLKKRKSRGYLKGEDGDEAERDLEHQESSHRAFLKMCDWKKEWVKIECVERGRLLTPEEIHKKVVKVVEKIEVIE